MRVWGRKTQGSDALQGLHGFQHMLEPLVVQRSERRQGQAQPIAHQAEAVQRPFERDRIGFEKERGVQWCQDPLETRNLVGIARITGAMESGTQSRSDIRRDRNAAVATSQTKDRLGRVVAGQEQEVIAQPARRRGTRGMLPVASLRPRTRGRSARRWTVTSASAHPVRDGTS